MDYSTNDRNKFEYFEFYQSKSLPIYFSPVWLDGICGASNWDVILSKNPDNGIEGVFVYHLKHYYGKAVILMPPLTSFSGFWFNYPKGIKNHSKISFENKVYNKVLEQMPAHHLFFQQFHPDIQNWLPLQWKGYKQTTRYTYIIDLTKGLDEVWNDFKGNVRRNVRKAEKDYKIIELDELNEFWGPMEHSYKLRSKAVPFKKSDLEKIEAVCKPDGKRKMYVAVNDQGDHLGGIYLIYDDLSSYYLVGYFHPAYKDYAALTLAIWHGIQKMAELVPQFDFEGSIIPEIEFYFRAFGGKLTPHYKIYKTKNRLVSFLAQLKNPKIFD